MKKIGSLIFVLMIFFAFRDAGALTFKLYDSAGNPISNAGTDALFADLNNTVGKYTNQKQLALGSANAGVYSSSAATQRGYQGYDLFAISVGTMIGVQAPSLNPGYYSKIGSELKANGDLYAGAAWNPLVFQLGINAAALSDAFKDFYFALKFGSLKVKVGDFQFDSFIIGALANYQLINDHSIGANSLKWRGISVGTGLIYQSNKIDLKLPFNGQLFNGGIYQVKLDSIDTGIETTAFIIPVEATTAVRLLYILNLSVGAGFDLAAGSSKIKLGNTSTVTAGAIGGRLVVDGSTTGDGPTILRPKVTAGVGLGIGPVVIDLPVTYYLMSGFNAGLTFTIVW